MAEGGFLQSLAIALKLDTSDMSAGIQRVSREIDNNLKGAFEGLSPALDGITEEIARAAAEAEALGETSDFMEGLAEGLQAAAEEAGILGTEATETAQGIVDGFVEAAEEAGLLGEAVGEVGEAMEEASDSGENAGEQMVEAFENVADGARETADAIRHDIPAAAQQAASQMDRAFGGIQSKFKNFLMQIVGPIAGAFAIGNAVNTFISGAMAAKDAAQEIGTSSDELQLWQGAVTRAGGSAQKFDVSLRRMAASAKVTGDPLKAMYNLAGQAEKMSRDAFTAKAKELGIDVDTIGVLYQGRKALDEHLKRAKEIGIYEQRHIDVAQKLKIGLWELNGSFDGLKNELLIMVLPAMQKALQVLTDITLFVSTHAPFVATAIGVVGAALAIKLLPPLRELPKYIRLAWSAFTRWMPIIAIIAAIALVVEDFWGYLTGAESELADFWAIFGSGPEILAALQSGWAALKEVLVAVGTGLKNILKYLFNVGQASGILGDIGQAFRGLLQMIKGLFTLDWGTFHKGLANVSHAILDLLIAPFRAGAIMIQDLLNVIWDALRNMVPGFAKWADGIIDIFKGIFNLDFGQIASGISNAFSGGVEMAITALRNLLGIAGSIISAIVETIFGVDIDLSGMFTRAWDAVVEWFGSLKDWIWNWFKGLFSGIELPSIGDLLGGAGDIVGGAVSGAADMAKGAVGVVGNVLGGALDLGKSIGGWFKGLFSGADKDAVPPAQDAAATFSNAMKDAMDLDGLYDDIEPLTSAAGQTIDGVMADTASTVESGFNAAWSSTASVAVSEFQGAASTIQAIFASVIGNIGASLNGMIAGAQAMAAGGAMVPAFAGVRAANAGGTINNSSSAVNIGTMNVSTRATDANGMARGVKGALNKNRLVQAGQSGVNQK